MEEAPMVEEGELPSSPPDAAKLVEDDHVEEKAAVAKTLERVQKILQGKPVISV